VIFADVRACRPWFEGEVTGERIGDESAASSKKGMRMGW
jgi:hypothetical protein